MILFYILYFIIIILFIIILKKYVKSKNKFSDYLFNKNDTDTLYSLGIINKYGQRETRRVMFYVVEEKLLGKFEKTDDSEYINFYNIYNFYVKSKIAFIVLLVIVSLLFVIVLENIS
jgi:hypothetical protein